MQKYAKIKNTTEGDRAAVHTWAAAIPRMRAMSTTGLVKEKQQKQPYLAFQITSIVGNNNLIHLLRLRYILLGTQLTMLFFPEATFKEFNDLPFKKSINNYLC